MYYGNTDAAQLDSRRATVYGCQPRQKPPCFNSPLQADVWLPLKKRAGARGLDLYSARMMGHAQSTLVDKVYAHSLQSGMASVAENVTARASD